MQQDVGSSVEDPEQKSRAPASPSPSRYNLYVLIVKSCRGNAKAKNEEEKLAALEAARREYAAERLALAKQKQQVHLCFYT